MTPSSVLFLLAIGVGALNIVHKEDAFWLMWAVFLTGAIICEAIETRR